MVTAVTPKWVTAEYREMQLLFRSDFLEGLMNEGRGCQKRVNAMPAGRADQAVVAPHSRYPRCHFWLAVPAQSHNCRPAPSLPFQSRMSTHLSACGLTRSPAAERTNCWAAFPLQVAI
jgi:hypothetical protein